MLLTLHFYTAEKQKQVIMCCHLGRLAAVEPCGVGPPDGSLIGPVSLLVTQNPRPATLKAP